MVIFGDHGDEFYEHGRTGHAHTLYNELIHIPLILRLPSRIPKGKRVDALTSQVEIVKSHIRNFNEADAAVDKLISVFSAQSTLPQEVYQVANMYKDTGQSSRAIQLYQRVTQTWPDDNSAILSQKGIAMINISLDHHAAVDAVIGSMFVDFNDRPLLPKALLEIGERYYNIAFQNENRGLAAESKVNFNKTIAIWERIITELPPSHITPDVYFLSAVCYRNLEQYEQAIEYYQKVVSDWPDYDRAWNAQFMIARCFDRLARSGAIPKEDAAPIIRQACEKVIINYPGTMAIGAARNLLKRWESIKSN